MASLLGGRDGMSPWIEDDAVSCLDGSRRKRKKYVVQWIESGETYSIVSDGYSLIRLYVSSDALFHRGMLLLLPPTFMFTTVRWASAMRRVSGKNPDDELFHPWKEICLYIPKKDDSIIKPYMSDSPFPFVGSPHNVNTSIPVRRFLESFPTHCQLLQRFQQSQPKTFHPIRQPIDKQNNINQQQQQLQQLFYQVLHHDGYATEDEEQQQQQETQIKQEEDTFSIDLLAQPTTNTQSSSSTMHFESDALVAASTAAEQLYEERKRLFPMNDQQHEHNDNMQDLSTALDYCLERVGEETTVALQETVQRFSSLLKFSFWRPLDHRAQIFVALANVFLQYNEPLRVIDLYRYATRFLSSSGRLWLHYAQFCSSQGYHHEWNLIFPRILQIDHDNQQTPPIDQSWKRLLWNEFRTHSTRIHQSFTNLNTTTNTTTTSTQINPLATTTAVTDNNNNHNCDLPQSRLSIHPIEDNHHDYNSISDNNKDIPVVVGIGDMLIPEEEEEEDDDEATTQPPEKMAPSQSSAEAATETDKQTTLIDADDDVSTKTRQPPGEQLQQCQETTTITHKQTNKRKPTQTSNDEDLRLRRWHLSPLFLWKDEPAWIRPKKPEPKMPLLDTSGKSPLLLRLSSSHPPPKKRKKKKSIRSTTSLPPAQTSPTIATTTKPNVNLSQTHNDTSTHGEPSNENTSMFTSRAASFENDNFSILTGAQQRRRRQRKGRKFRFEIGSWVQRFSG